jgi:hypothetical protein
MGEVGAIEEAFSEELVKMAKFPTDWFIYTGR